jgi:hypothetical protein
MPETKVVCAAWREAFLAIISTLSGRKAPYSYEMRRKPARAAKPGKKQAFVSFIINRQPAKREAGVQFNRWISLKDRPSLHSAKVFVGDAQACFVI